MTRTTNHQERNIDIKLTVVESNIHLEASIQPREDFKMFYQAEITATLIVAVTDLGTIAIWKGVSDHMLFCKYYPVLSFTECSA